MNPIRAAVSIHLAQTDAFLRCDRGSALYVSNLPFKTPDWPGYVARLESNGFTCRLSGQMLFLTPAALWQAPFIDWAAGLAHPDNLTLQLNRRKGFPICEEEIQCWLDGIKRLDLKQYSTADNYERLVRQTAAVALRKKCGGLLTACGLCLNLLKEQ